MNLNFELKTGKQICMIFFCVNFAYEQSWVAYRIASGRIIVSYLEMRNSPSLYVAARLGLFDRYLIFSTLQVLLPAMWPSSQLEELGSIMQSSARW